MRPGLDISDGMQCLAVLPCRITLVRVLSLCWSQILRGGHIREYVLLLLFPTPICPRGRRSFYCYIQGKPYHSRPDKNPLPPPPSNDL